MQPVGDQLTRVEQTSLNTCRHMFAQSTSDVLQRSNQTTKACTDAYNPKDRPAETLWCMDSTWTAVKNVAAHIFKRRWPVITAVELRLDMYSPANLFSAQKNIEKAFDRLQLVLCPRPLKNTVSCLSASSQMLLVHSPLLCYPVLVHILSPDLSPKIVHNSIRDDATNAPITLGVIDGQLLQVATEARPAKLAFAWHAEGALRIGKALGWPSASHQTVPPVAWSSETCDSAIFERHLHE
ncbi:TPA: hypothetical protein ACH3X1_003589 [Trebouxia sp. C0004]